MAKRQFQLPGIQDLSKEQEDARALPIEGQHLIIGGPGTGKSVLALLRSRRLSAERANYAFLIFNHLLRQASEQLFDGELPALQWQTWFNAYYAECCSESIPRLPPKKPRNLGDVIWDSVLEKISEIKKLPENLPFLVIDEGQDMPPAFYKALIGFGFENFFVVADQNQQIFDGKNSNRQDIENALAVDTSAVIELKNNYRNKYPIARLAREFYTGDPASPPPELPKPTKKSAKTPILFEYREEQFQRIINRIMQTSDRDPSKLIGIIAPRDTVREKYYDALIKVDISLDNPKPAINTFFGGAKHEMSFNQGGIMVINAQACKGLEFDIVFIADINQFYCKFNDRDNVKRLFYVMVARAVDQIIMLKELGKHCAVDDILPTDESILERK